MPQRVRTRINKKWGAQKIVQDVEKEKARKASRTGRKGFQFTKGARGGLINYWRGEKTYKKKWKG